MWAAIKYGVELPALYFNCLLTQLIETQRG